MKDHYIKALKTILADPKVDEAAVLKNLKSALERRGHGKLLPAILRGLVRELPQQKTEITLTVSNNADTELQKLLPTLTELVAELAPAAPAPTKDTVSVKTDKTLIGGYTLEAYDHIVDRSYKASLLKLYRTIVN